MDIRACCPPIRDQAVNQRGENRRHRDLQFCQTTQMHAGTLHQPLRVASARKDIRPVDASYTIKDPCCVDIVLIANPAAFANTRIRL